MLRSVALLALCLLLVLPASAQGIFSDSTVIVLDGTPPPPPPRGLIDEIRARDTLRVGISTFEPWAMYNRNGELVGFEVDVAERLAEDLGVYLHLIPNSPATMIADLNYGDYDVIVSGMNITPQRALQVDFTHPYGYSEISVLANKAKVDGRMAAGDFNHPDVTIGVRRDASAADLVADQMPRATVETFEDDVVMIQALRNGQLDAIVTYSPIPEFAAAEFPDELMIPEGGVLVRRPEAMAVRKGSQGLLNYLNAWTSYYQTDPWMTGRRAYWFESSGWVDDIVPSPGTGE